MRSLHNVLAPAKLNLFLHITGRRDDGYHLLQSVFMLIDWCDTLHFDVRDDGVIEREDVTVALPADDLVVRAAQSLQRASGTSLGAHIAIEKHIPAQAGMGGGSSDAATTLLTLNRLWGLHWPLSKLMPLGLALGADVPFFLGGHNAWVEGIGEKMTPIDLPSARFAVVKPNAGLETAKIFRSPELQRATETATMPVFAVNHYGFGRNDLQPVAQALCPEMTEALQWLSSFGLSPRMTGSGSAVFARLHDGVLIDSAPNNWQMRICSNLAVHPQAGWAASES
ncbi:MULTISPECIES: 4-(cytidine 5'-diphospho)-2-C-methyl-D-erythritol kinase [unclassified Limnohabitans]|uniref:4-(cytidine 5'-diphospho)-2-C-methyl-D-erythritol kinase n=1 Tax=unclassified Limnohabitans TaxID=2626134 RepID=UPI000CF20D4D|nr:MULTISPECIES: 4-(cytidine 5'-diphospho)-2-C-methyl-D-erythritol kinase [unclassified Limnohabitans]PQA79725.1 4-(cytidine 5'-diphospho)-2-C-methyl-D-erythritol kinase [Limnohabitans sp. TS-CS-82]BDU56207.1 4-diphosphocytidyl-2-C-methyl-D-erythritol kinase [Limnohabitans sp. TEGF004]